MAKKKPVKESSKAKKEFKQSLANKLESALPELRIKLGKKKFDKRVKKVTKLFTAGIHLNGDNKKINKSIVSNDAGNKTETAGKAV